MQIERPQIAMHGRQRLPTSPTSFRARRPPLLRSLEQAAVVIEDGQVGLESIDLSYNEITDSGAQKLMFALAAGAAPHLKQLNVHKTSITEVSRRQLAGLKLLRKGLSVLVDDEDKNCLLAREL